VSGTSRTAFSFCGDTTFIVGLLLFFNSEVPYLMSEDIYVKYFGASIDDSFQRRLALNNTEILSNEVQQGKPDRLGQLGRSLLEQDILRIRRVGLRPTHKPYIWQTTTNIHKLNDDELFYLHRLSAHALLTRT